MSWRFFSRGYIFCPPTRHSRCVMNDASNEAMMQMEGFKIEFVAKWRMIFWCCKSAWKRFYFPNALNLSYAAASCLLVQIKREYQANLLRCGAGNSQRKAFHLREQRNNFRWSQQKRKFNKLIWALNRGSECAVTSSWRMMLWNKSSLMKIVM